MVVDRMQILHTRNVAMATNFWLSIGYNFAYVTASDTLFDSVGGFSGSSYLTKTEPISRL